MATEKWDGVERRRFERFKMNLYVELQVVEPGGPPKRQNGRTVNLSRGGVLLSVGREPRKNARCRVIFKSSEGYVSPDQMLGRVVYTGPGEGRDFRVAIEFDKPLDDVNPDGP